MPKYLLPPPVAQRGKALIRRPPSFRRADAFEITVNDGTQGHVRQWNVGDTIWAKVFNGTSQVENYWTVLSVADDGPALARFRYDVRRVSGSAAMFPAGTPLVQVASATAGQNFISLSADGQIGAAPNITIGQYTTTPWSAPTVLARLGNLNGSYGAASDVIGVGLGIYKAGQSNIVVDDASGIRIRNYATVVGQWNPAGDFKIGTDISAAASTNLAVFNAAQTYNAESLGVGDLLLGDNSTGKANLLWKKSTGILKLRTGTQTTVFLDTTGALTIDNVDPTTRDAMLTLKASGYTGVVGTFGVYDLGGGDYWTEIGVGSDFIRSKGSGWQLLNGSLNSLSLTSSKLSHSYAGTISDLEFGQALYDRFSLRTSRVTTYNDFYFYNATRSRTDFAVKGGTGATAGFIGIRTTSPANLLSLGNTSGQQLGFDDLTELTTVAAAATTDTAIQIPLNAVVLGVSVRVVTVIPTAATFTVTGATSGTAFHTAAVSTAAGTTDAGTANCPYKNGAAQKIRITPNLTPAAATGQVRVTVHFYAITPPTS